MDTWEDICAGCATFTPVVWRRSLMEDTGTSGASSRSPTAGPGCTPGDSWRMAWTPGKPRGRQQHAAWKSSRWIAIRSSAPIQEEYSWALLPLMRRRFARDCSNWLRCWNERIRGIPEDGSEAQGCDGYRIVIAYRQCWTLARLPASLSAGRSQFKDDFAAVRVSANGSGRPPAEVTSRLTIWG